MKVSEILSAPPRRLMRHNEMVNWLEENGLTPWEIKQMLQEGVIKRLQVRPHGKYGFFNADQIKQALDGNHKKEKT